MRGDGSGLPPGALARGVPYLGADFRFDPVRFAPYPQAALAVIGTGKRVGQDGRFRTCRPAAFRLAGGRRRRDGPRRPARSRSWSARPSVADLLELSRSGVHAASDYLEDAVLAGIVTVGARRCGGGLAGQPFVTNVEEAAQLAAGLGPELVLLEASGATIPPVEAGARILVAGAHQKPQAVTGHLGAYRLLVSDLVVLTMCEEPLATPEQVNGLRLAIASVDPELPVIATVLRPRPVEPDGRAPRGVLLHSTRCRARPLRQHLEREHGAKVVFVSGNLADREALLAELDSPAVAEAEAFVTEIKAAAIDVVAEVAETRGIPVVFADNEVVPLPGELDLDGAVVAIADAVLAARAPA